MHRIDTKTAQKDKFGAGKNGFTRGNPQTGTPATDLDDDYFDMLQEELCSVVEASGASLEKGRHDQLLTALRALLLSRKNPFGDIKSDGTVQTALENLGLGTAATKNVGTGAGQIPDMSSFSSGSGWQRLPGGVIIQWGNAISGQTGDAHINPFPIAFTDLASIQIVATYDNPDAPNGPVFFAAKASTTSSFKVLNSLPNANVAYARWIAIGR
ncbi:hypothetical protein [Escherichia coli]|uniref:gp53-like domain-containing protein n=1 Tax=Escherichia coli TaxID=562 RepID=UPI0020254D15|nr:hypothetical protein [Escherichia coli]HDM1960712.1 hypothetical protein [Escherichia coli]